MMFFQHVPEIFKEEICAKLNIYIKKVLKGETNAVDAPVLLKFTIDYDKWAANNELRPVLLEILNEPLQSQKDIQMATWCFTTAILYRKQINGLQMHQVHCAIRISNLPMTRKLQFVPFGYPARLSLSFMRCVLHSFSDRCTYVRQSIWFCPKQCPADQNHILNGEYSDIPKCSSCCTNLQENEVSDCVQWHVCLSVLIYQFSPCYYLASSIYIQLPIH